jgi:predicted nuclease of predicted toxin-antitoxin system
MWLLDVNLPTALLGVLRSHGIDCDAAAGRGWRDLTNGLLSEAAFRAGFRVILTRDRGFGESAARVLRSLPELAVVVVTLPQARAGPYVTEFKTRWEMRPIEPIAGRIVEWPQ